MKKNKIWGIIGTMCLIASSVLIVIQMKIRHEDNQEKKRKWDAEAREYTINKCLNLFVNAPISEDMKQDRLNICKCYLNKLEIKHSFYESRYYLENKQHNTYLDSCKKAVSIFNE